MTHPLEVAQIAGGVMRQLAKTYSFPFLPSLSVIQTSGSGTISGILRSAMEARPRSTIACGPHGGFEGNGQMLESLQSWESGGARD